MVEDTNGHGWASWVKFGSLGAGGAAFLVGLLNSVWGIDARLEQHGKLLETLAVSVKMLSDKSASLETVDSRIERACMQMALANRGFVCPFAPAAAKRPTAKAPAKG